MSHTTQPDGAVIQSLLQPGALLYSPPEPLPGSLELGPIRKVGNHSDVHSGTWTYNGKIEAVCIKRLRNTAPAEDSTCPGLSREERFQRVRPCLRCSSEPELTK